MATVYHTNTTALNAPGRFPPACLMVDARYRRQPPPWPPAAVEALFPSPQVYLFAPSLGSVECANYDYAAICPVIDYRSGLAAIQAVIVGDQDLVVLCDCREAYGRSHRRLVARELAAALGLVDGGALP